MIALQYLAPLVPFCAGLLLAVECRGLSGWLWPNQGE